MTLFLFSLTQFDRLPPLPLDLSLKPCRRGGGDDRRGFRGMGGGIDRDRSRSRDRNSRLVYVGSVPLTRIQVGKVADLNLANPDNSIRLPTDVLTFFFTFHYGFVSSFIN